MPYRKGRSYRRAARLYRKTGGPPPRSRPALLAAILAVALAAALAVAFVPRPGSVLSASSKPANSDCAIIVPEHPLSAAGLATPYRLTGPRGTKPAASGCTEANAVNLGAFVQATILDPATGALSVYEPLVITQGTRPAAAPVVPALPKGAVVTIDIGFNGTNLRQIGATPRALRQGNCVNGLRGSVFGQVSFCNGPAFFRAAYRAEARGKLKIPSAGISPRTGQACPTTRSFTLIDQDQSDNVTTQYLLTAAGRTAPYNERNRKALPRATVISNGSDNALLDRFVDPALGCRPFEAPDLSQGGAPGTSQALDELSAARNQAAPRALVPENDPMVLVRNAFSVAKTDLYRSSVGQPPVSKANNPVDSPAEYCQNMIRFQMPFLRHDQEVMAPWRSPVPSIGDNLLTFMAYRLVQSFGNLRCRRYGLSDPVHVTLNEDGVATAVRFGRAEHRDPDRHDSSR